MKKIFIWVILMSIIFMPTINAAEVEESNVFQTTKYYKTIINNVSAYSISSSQPITIEVTKEEYDNCDSALDTYAYVETIYKKITSTITSSGNYYKYTGTLTWKNIPSVRSYDIFGVGFYSSVKVKNNNFHFSQSYCLSSGNCYTSSTHYPQIFTSGVGTTFLLPSGNLTSLSATIYFDVEKNTTSTITSQLAAVDHSHATKSISLTNAKKYSVSGATGIVLNGISSYYDAINPAKAYWSGSW